MPEVKVQEHTPGPWAWKNEGHPDAHTYGIYAPGVVNPLARANAVGIRDGYPGGVGPEETIANARLIAAAPLLLAALREASERLWMYADYGDSVTDAGIYETCRQAIRAAEGVK